MVDVVIAQELVMFLHAIVRDDNELLTMLLWENPCMTKSARDLTRSEQEKLSSNMSNTFYVLTGKRLDGD